MNQSTKIFAFLSIAFVIFITMRGELATYLSLLTKSGAGISQGLAFNGSNATADKAAAALTGETQSTIASAGTYQPTHGVNMQNVATTFELIGAFA